LEECALGRGRERGAGVVSGRKWKEGGGGGAWHSEEGSGVVCSRDPRYIGCSNKVPIVIVNLKDSTLAWGCIQVAMRRSSRMIF